MISKENALLLSKNEELLISELCSRLPYGVICECDKISFKGELREINLTYNMCRLYNVENDTSEICYIYDCKPYLFPMSSLTDEQREAYINLCVEDTIGGIYYLTPDTVKWFYKNQIDHMGLIKSGIAKDATKLKIY